MIRSKKHDVLSIDVEEAKYDHDFQIGEWYKEGIKRARWEARDDVCKRCGVTRTMIRWKNMPEHECHYIVGNMLVQPSSKPHCIKPFNV
jgi:hypothetical protein